MRTSYRHGSVISRTAGFLLWCVLLCCGLLASRAGVAACIDSADPAILALEELANKDASKAITAARERLAALERAPQTQPHQVAALYAVLALAYTGLELDGEARDAAAAGLKVAPMTDDLLRLKLLAVHAVNVYDAAGLRSAAAAIEAALASASPGSTAQICLLIALGTVQHRQDRDDLAVTSLTNAYRMSMTPELAKQRVLAAGMLSSVMDSLDDFDQALALNQELIDWNAAREAWLQLSVTRFQRGNILRNMQNYPASAAEFAEARRLSVLLGDRQGIAFADLRQCQSRIELGELAAARRLCENALEIFTASQSTDVLKDTMAQLARIDLAEGRPIRALATLNSVLDQQGADIPPRRVAALYELRARGNAALHDYRQAYADLQEYLRRYVAANDAERNKEVSALRTRFEIDQQVARNELLQRELALEKERTQRQKEQLQWIVAAAIAGVFVIVLLTYILYANLRHKRQLAQLADLDALTALPNRRRTAELATQALAAAAEAQRPLTIAIVDLDHFKTINDRCGHATGDHVLREFGAIARASLRAVDIVGRWGGEEFLVILPDTTLDAALASLQRLRAAGLRIQLPDAAAGLRVSFSAGLATNEAGVDKLDEIIAQADTALYEAKHQGRDLVRIAEESFLMASSGVHRALRAVSAERLR